MGSSLEVLPEDEHQAEWAELAEGFQGRGSQQLINHQTSWVWTRGLRGPGGSQPRRRWVLIDLGVEKQQLEREPESEREIEREGEVCVCEKDQREGGRERERKAEQVEQGWGGEGKVGNGRGAQRQRGRMERRWARRPV